MAAAAPFVAQALISAAVSYAVSYLLAPDVQGPRLQNRAAKRNAYGDDMSIVYGRMIVTGSLIWFENNELKEKRKKESGKGGPTVTTYSYSFTGSHAFHDGPICGVRKVWADNTLVYSYYDDSFTEAQNIILSDDARKRGYDAWTDFSN